jgi:hypothetical protein
MVFYLVAGKKGLLSLAQTGPHERRSLKRSR